MPSPLKIWTHTLRGERFVQGTGCLSSQGKHCCLGVGCEVYAEQTNPDQFRGGREPFVKRNSKHGAADRFGGEGSYLPMSVVRWLGLEDRNPETGITDRAGVQQSLTTLNDDGLTFAQIADVIDYVWGETDGNEEAS